MCNFLKIWHYKQMQTHCNNRCLRHKRNKPQMETVQQIADTIKSDKTGRSANKSKPTLQITCQIVAVSLLTTNIQTNNKCKWNSNSPNPFVYANSVRVFL